MAEKKKPVKDSKILLQELIIQQGLILESEVYEHLSSHFGSSLNPISKISFQVIGQNQQTQEVDVFALVNQNVRTIQNLCFGSVDDNNRPINIFSVGNVFLIECKGHPSHGILLGRLHHQRPNENLFFRSHVSYQEPGDVVQYFQQGGGLKGVPVGNWKWGYMKRQVAPIIDSCVFYAHDEKNNRYSESKDKLFKAIQQISSASQLFDFTMSAWQSAGTNMKGCTVTPIICSNVPITVMEILGDQVHLLEFDWAFVVNPEFGTEKVLANRPDYRLIPVVHSAALGKFCDATLSDDPNSLFIDQSKGRLIHTFSIKDAQKMFREEKK